MTRRVLRAFLVSTLLAAAGLPALAAVPPPKLQYDISTLPNGLTVVLSEDHSTPIVHLKSGTTSDRRTKSLAEPDSRTCSST